MVETGFLLERGGGELTLYFDIKEKFVSSGGGITKSGELIKSDQPSADSL